jgi:F-type H+-transporting ATPase subunit a
MDVSINGAKILCTIDNVPLFGQINITQTLVMSWIVMGIITALCWWLGSGLTVENVSRKQAVAELAVTKLVDFVHGNMGMNFDKYIPLVGALFASSVVSNLISLLGFWSPTADLSTELGWALVVFVLITYYKIKSNGIGGYLKGYLDPIFLMAPINVISEFFTPISMACRHFGNILSGTVISALLYAALAAASHALFGLLPGVLGAALSQFPFLDIGIPALTSLYFDWFGGCIQAFIFCTLTTIFIKQAAGDD